MCTPTEDPQRSICKQGSCTKGERDEIRVIVLVLTCVLEQYACLQQTEAQQQYVQHAITLLASESTNSDKMAPLH